MPDSDTIGSLLDQGVEVVAHCVACNLTKTADLPAMAAKLSGEHSLRNYRCKCRTPGCYRGWVQFSIRGGMRNTPLVDPDVKHRWMWEEPDRWRPNMPKPERGGPPQM